VTQAETNARKFDAKAIDEWAKYGHTGNVQHKDNAEWWDRAAAQEWAKVQQEAAQAALAKPAAKPVRTPVDECRVRALKAFFKTAKAAGLDTNNAEAMKQALAKYLGCVVSSRRDLSAGQWREAIAGLEFGLVSW
jgi:hypothetical protein